MIRRMLTVIMSLLLLPLLASDITYLGSTTSGDITAKDNWDGGVTPGASDTAIFPSVFSVPSTGLYLGSALTLGMIDYQATAAQSLDLGGKTLTLASAPEISLAASSSLTVKNGTLDFSPAVGQLNPKGDGGEFILTNATINITNPNWCFSNGGKNFTTRILSGGKLICSEKPSGDMYFPIRGKYGIKFIVDGGFVSAVSVAGSWRRLGIGQNWEDGQLWIVNGGVFEDAGNSFWFDGTKARVLIDGGYLYQTNALSWYGYNYGLNFTGDRNVFAATNATVKASRFNCTGKNNRMTLHNSTMKLSQSPNASYAGFHFSDTTTGGNKVLISGTSSFNAYILNFSAASANVNEFELAGGTFESPVEFASANTNGLLTISGGEVKGSAITMKATADNLVQSGGLIDANSSIKLEGACNQFTLAGGTNRAPVTLTSSNQRLNVSGGVQEGAITTSGSGHELTMTGGEMSYTKLSLASTDSTWRFADNFSAIGTSMTMNGSGTTMIQDGCAITGGVLMTAANTTCIITNGAYRYMKHRNDGFQIPNGTANAQLVICDATLENNAAFHGTYTPTAGIKADAGSVSVNCPGSAIVFAGTHPKFLCTGRTLWEGGSIYVAMVFGSFANGVVGTEPLTDPVALKYILPATGYAEAPLQNVQPDAATTDGRPIAMCGNAKIIVDASAYQLVPGKRASIPLVRDLANFTCGGVLLLDIDALNANNAANLPAGSRLEHVVERDANGKVIAGRIDLVMGYAGFLLLIR